MAGPISGIGVQQQVPLTQSLQQNSGNDQLRESNENEPEENNVASAEGTRTTESTVETQAPETENNADPSLQALREEAFNIDDGSEAERPGSLVDIVV